MKTTQEARIGETLYCASTNRDEVQSFASFTPNKPSVFAGLYPFNPSEYEQLKKALERLILNDAAVQIHSDSSPILGKYSMLRSSN